MADSVLTVTVTQSYADRQYYAYGTIAVSPSPGTYPTGGYALNLGGGKTKATRTPVRVTVEGQNGYIYKYIPGTGATNGKLKVFTGAAAQSPLTELAAGATPAGISGDTITFMAQWLGML